MWAMMPAKPISSPLAKIGLSRVLRHVAAAAIGIVVDDDVALLEVTAPSSSTTYGTCEAGADVAGLISAWPISRSALNSTHEKSRDSLKIGE